MLLQKEKQSIEEIGKKDKKIYERRKVSLSNIYDLLFPQKSRKYFRTNAKEHIREVSSVKVSFCTSFRGRIKKEVWQWKQHLYCRCSSWEWLR